MGSIVSDKNNNSQQYQVIIDLCYTLITLYTVKYTLLQFAVMWTFAGPISLLAALTVATWRLRISGESWLTLGLFKVGKKSSLFLWTAVALGAAIAVGVLLNSLLETLFASNTSITATAINESMQDRFVNVPGNIPVYIYWLMVSWVIGGFTEELLFRGFLLLRLEQLFKKLPLSLFFAIIIQAIMFGQLHMYYQGLEGLIVGGMFAVISAVIFISCQRRLWPLIISHGLNNTLGMTVLFLSET